MIIARIVVLNDIAKLLTVARAAAWIWIQHDITFSRHPLKFVVEDEAVGAMRTTMDVEDERILPGGIEVGRLLHPSLNPAAIKTLIPNLLGLSETQLSKQLVIEVR